MSYIYQGQNSAIPVSLKMSHGLKLMLQGSNFNQLFFEIRNIFFIHLFYERNVAKFWPKVFFFPTIKIILFFFSVAISYKKQSIDFKTKL